MSNKEQVLSRCKAVVESGGKCPESGVHVYCHQSIADRFFELCYDGAKMYVNADGTGEGFEAAAKWLGLHNPWRLPSTELPEDGCAVLAYYSGGREENDLLGVIKYENGKWVDLDYESKCNPPTKWKYVESPA